MNRRALYATVITSVCIAGCATGAASSRLRAVADNVLIFDRAKIVTVSVRNSSSVYEQNLADLVRKDLRERGINVGGTSNYDYVLQVAQASHTTSRTVYETVMSSSYSTLSVGGQRGNVSTKTYSPVATQQNATYSAVSLTLWDALDKNSSKGLPVIWKGVIVGRADELNGREVDVVSQLVSRIGSNAELDVKLTMNTRGVAALSAASTGGETGGLPLPADAGYFTVRGTQVNEFVRTSNGKSFDGYLKTRQVKTRKFSGYTQMEGFNKYPAPDAEIESNALGMGAYVVRADGLYTVDGMDLRDLDEAVRQMVLSFPLKIGASRTVTIFAGATLAFVVESRAKAAVPAGTFDDCVVLRLTTTVNGSAGVERNWFCKGVGFVKMEGEGTTVELTRHYVSE